MNPYEHYKDSGISWICEIPEHWEVRRLKNCVVINPATTQQDLKGEEEAQIEALRKYWQSLITEVVTSRLWVG